MTTPFVIIATPHDRNNLLERQLQERLPGYQVMRLSERYELTVEMLERIRPDFVFFPHWSWLIPEEIHAQFDCVIFHITDLPYGRGGSPLQNLIVRGYKETKLTALKCVSELDAGPIYLKRPLSLVGTAEEILQRASASMEEMIVDIVKNRPAPVPQDGRVIEFSRRQPRDGNLASLVEIGQVYDYIRMLDAEGYPPAFIDTGCLHFEFSEANLNEEFVEAKVRIRRESND